MHHVGSSIVRGDEAVIAWILYVLCVLVFPFLIIAIIRKTKARLQNRIGPPMLQPFYDFMRLCRKGETISEVMSWMFRSTACINVVTMLVLSMLIPWLCFKPSMAGSDLFLVIYLFALARMFTIMASMDAGSAFGAFGASREATISLLVEPGAVLSLAALGTLSHTSDLSTIFSFNNTVLMHDIGLWLLVGTSILLSSVIELSRMPVDDPTTHLELTMVHEAMILEASGRNLALTEYAQGLRMSLLFGLAANCYIHAIPALWNASELVKGLANVGVILALAIGLGVFESTAVKLNWRKVPEFIAYALTMSLLAALLAAGGGVFQWH